MPNPHICIVDGRGGCCGSPLWYWCPSLSRRFALRTIRDGGGGVSTWLLPRLDLHQNALLRVQVPLRRSLFSVPDTYISVDLTVSGEMKRQTTRRRYRVFRICARESPPSPSPQLRSSTHVAHVVKTLKTRKKPAALRRTDLLGRIFLEKSSSATCECNSTNAASSPLFLVFLESDSRFTRCNIKRNVSRGTTSVTPCIHIARSGGKHKIN